MSEQFAVKIITGGTTLVVISATEPRVTKANDNTIDHVDWQPLEGPDREKIGFIHWPSVSYLGWRKL
jgi:hypothetical protein